MKLAWTPEARADRRAIYTYIEAENASAAIALDELFAKRSKQLLAHPMAGRPGRISGTRELVVHRNYLLVYDLTDEMVRIIRILHAAQQWPPNDFQPIS
ncbi:MULTISPECIES: type II toxin-antitoxin system RelE/ParE family toxin [unclassified Rhizobium]|uniref:type II toxin-antitoxin system RelE/ParE family toxin n=1 Tax=unclassified Rhizobium TaxID=2613769 RepID=UPI000EA93F1C|nr:MULTISPECIES: type II toxin-antitoxin system RelE/ParE family toxin [unclassified Rhizobium]AYG64785.1 type II toxin-antitoxin system RelE/ParE family toxin [Rhizobium sp. CCGE531]AYG71269.1 type II toxin-antitoxin system RelE/ParE family toxin [Rhizobium sp. CCGE532]